MGSTDDGSVTSNNIIITRDPKEIRDRRHHDDGRSSHRSSSSSRTRNSKRSRDEARNEEGDNEENLRSKVRRVKALHWVEDNREKGERMRKFLGGRHDEDFLREQRKDPLKMRNPHLVQAKEIVFHRRPFGGSNRVLAETAPREAYRRRKFDLKSTLHWGQRKLLMSEIEFLTTFGYDGATVLYAGAAPGTHTGYLSDLFPQIHFVLVDPGDFKCKESDQITIRQEYFTDETAKEFSGKNVLFISDIRTASWQHMEDDEVEQYVQSDMDDQMRWHTILKPHKSMLKFRLPYVPGKTEYLDGDIYLPVWGPQTTTETRLVPHGDETKIYDNTEYEEKMFYFNSHTRVTFYKHDIVGEGLDHCFDCMSEIYILQEYLRKHKPEIAKDKNLQNKEVSELSYKISRVISGEGGRNLADTPLNVIKRFDRSRTEKHKQYHQAYREARSSSQ